MSQWAEDRGAAVEDDLEVEKLLGPARLAYFTPVREYPPLSDRKSVTLLTFNGLMIMVMCLFAEEIHVVLQGNPVVMWPAIVAGLSWFSLLIIGACYTFLALTRPIPRWAIARPFIKTSRPSRWDPTGKTWRGSPTAARCATSSTTITASPS